jgi:hypothetical protein
MPRHSMSTTSAMTHNSPETVGKVSCKKGLISVVVSAVNSNVTRLAQLILVLIIFVDGGNLAAGDGGEAPVTTFSSFIKTSAEAVKFICRAYQNSKGKRAFVQNP